MNSWCRSLSGKADDLCLDGRTVSGTYALDGPGIQGAFVQVFPDDPVGLLRGICQPARGPVFRGMLRLEAEGQGRRIPLLELHFGKVDASPVHPGGRAGLEPAKGQAQGQQALRQGARRVESVGAGVLHTVAHDGAAPQIGAGAEHRRPDPVHGAGSQHHTGNTAVFRANRHRFRLAQGQMLLPLQGVLHDLLIGPAVRLGPQGPHGWPLAGG